MYVLCHLLWFGPTIHSPLPVEFRTFCTIKDLSSDAVLNVAMTKKQRQKYERKQEKLLKTIPKRVPLHEQSKDLTGPQDDAVVSLERRQEVTKSSRGARRKEIRESNFLRSM